MTSYTQPNFDQMWWKKISRPIFNQKCLILWSEILLNALHNLSLIAELRRPEGAPYSYRKDRKPMSWFSHGYHGQRHCSWARTYDDDDDDGVAQDGSHTPNIKLTETYSLGLPSTFLILDIHVMINWPLSKQDICWPVARDHIAGSRVQFIEVMCFLKLTADQVLVFD